MQSQKLLKLRRLLLLAVCSTVALAEQQIDTEVLCTEQSGECDVMSVQTGMDKLDGLTQVQTGTSESVKAQPDLAVVPDFDIKNAKLVPYEGGFQKGSPYKAYIDRFQALDVPDYVIGDAQRNYVVTDTNIVFHHLSGGRYNRQIYSIQPLGEIEVELIDGFKAWAKEKGVTIPEWTLDQNNYALRYISSFREDYQKTFDFIMEHQNWMINDVPKVFEQEEKWINILKSGMMYGMGRDKYQRPVFYLHMKRVIEMKLNLEELIGYSDYFNSYVIANAMVPGRVEQYVLIFDLKDVSIFDFPVSDIVEFSRHGTVNYKQRNGMSLYVNVPWMFRLAIQLFSSVLDEGQLLCNKFFGDDYRPFLDEMIGLEYVQEKYGGKLPNQPEDKSDFPPHFNL